MHLPGLFTEYVLLLCYVYFAFSWLVNRKRIRRAIELFFEFILIAIALGQIKSDNLKLAPIPLIISMIYFPILFLMTSISARQVRANCRFKSIYQFLSSLLNIYPVILLNVLIEELIWRVCYVYLLSHLQIPEIIIAVSGALLFTIAHLKLGKKLILLVQIEFILFSLMLYTLFMVYQSLILIWLIHFFRNIIIKEFQSITIHD